MSFRLIFDPVTAGFDLKNTPPTIVAGGGGTVNAGTVVISPDSQITFQNELTVSGAGEILLGSGSDLIIE